MSNELGRVKRRCWRASAGLGGLLGTVIVLGVQMVPLSLAELSHKADLVLYGHVLSKTCLRDADRRIYTEVVLDVRETWKGTLAGARFTIVLAGGTLGEERCLAPGQADYRPGEEVVAFLRLNRRGQGVTLGLAQGKFEVWRQSADGPRLVRNLFLGRSEGSPRTTRAQATTGAGLIPLADLKRQVQEASR
jgi:hypothetical protein